MCRVLKDQVAKNEFDVLFLDLHYRVKCNIISTFLTLAGPTQAGSISRRETQKSDAKSR